MVDGLVILHTYSEMTFLGFLLIFLGGIGVAFTLTVGIFIFIDTPSENQIAVISILIVLFVAAIIVGCKLPRNTLLKAYAQDVANRLEELLKAQEARVMTPQDFDGNPMKDQYGNLPCWLESREPLVASNWCRWNEDDFIRPMMRNFRPWTSRPTYAQREATPWHSEESVGE